MKELRAVLVGCGGMSGEWFKSAAKIEGLRIVGVVDIDVNRAAARAKEFNLADAVAGTDVATVLSQTKPDVVFDVVVPPARHAVVAAALDAGCHVLSEKPMADTLDQAKDLVARAAKAGRVHAVIQNRRYNSQVRRVRQFIASKAIGDVTSVHCDFFVGPHFGGFREEMRHVLLLDMAIHTFDAARYLLADSAVAVYAHEWDPKSSWYHQGSSASAIFEMSSGAIFNYRGSWCAEGLPTSWESTWRVICTNGTLLWDGGENIRAAAVERREGFVSPTKDVEIPPAEPSNRLGHYGVMADFIDAVRGGPDPQTLGRENIKSLAMVDGAIRSSETKQRVQITV